MQFCLPATAKVARQCKSIYEMEFEMLRAAAAAAAAAATSSMRGLCSEFSAEKPLPLSPAPVPCPLPSLPLVWQLNNSI